MVNLLGDDELERSGEAAALTEAEIVGVDLVDFFAVVARPPRLRLVTASITGWEPDGVFDLITSVHGLHYVGDKLAAITRAASWLAPDGLFVASFDTRSVRRADGRLMGPALARALRAAGFLYDGRAKRLSRRGGAEALLPFTYLGSDDQAGPNYTGQAAVNSHYR